MPFGLITAAFAIGSAIKGNQARQAGEGRRAALAKITKIKNRQQKRDFINKFRFAQANALSLGSGTLGGLDSSRSQGSAASTISQFGQGILEFEAQAKFGKEAGRLADKQENASFASNLLSTGSSLAANPDVQALFS